MTTHARPGLGAALAAAAALLVACPAIAQMTPVADYREIDAHAHYHGFNAGSALTPPGFFAVFNATLDEFAEDPDAGFAEAFAGQISEFFPAGIYGSGHAYGAWQIDSGDYDALSLMSLRVRLDNCLTYSLDATVDPGDPGSDGHIEVRDAVSGTVYVHVDSGHQTLTGRLSPGEYFIEGRSSVASSVENLNGPAYAIIWTCSQCPSPLIALQPRDTTTACGAMARFSVTPLVPPGSVTYQWRRSLVPLTNDGHIAGATSSTLTINNACDADTGYYDVVLTAGTIVEPSRVAHLGKTVPTSVEIAPAAPSGIFTLDAATPNPFQSLVSFHYAIHHPAQVTAAIYDAAGRMIRPIADGVVTGPGVLTWDGRATSGATAPTGIYFLRVNVDGQAQVRRFVRVR